MLFDEKQFEIGEVEAYATIPPEYDKEYEDEEEIMLFDEKQFENGEAEAYATIPPE